jgi:ornithine carbamoyltransferase
MNAWPRSDNDIELEQIQRVFTPYQITEERLAMAKPDGLFLPCPPVHRGQEVSDGAMASDRCRVHEAKEYLLHVQNALMLSLIG